MILTVTFNPAVDQTMTFDESLRPGAVSRATDARFDAGGKGVNVSQYLAALDADTVATGLLGGFTGTYIRQSLSESGVPTDFVDIDEPTRLNTTALAAGEEYKLNQNGPDVDASVVDDLTATARSHGPDRVLVGGSLPPGLDPDVIDRVADAGEWRTAVDVGGDVLAALEGEYDLAKPNRDELAAATGAAVETVAECAEAARRLRERGFERVVASLGGEGALLAGPDGVVFAEAFDVDVVDTVGAGDALLSGVLAALDRGLSDEAALGNGVAVASRVVQRAGTSVPDFEGLDADRDAVETRRL
ncbi:1-phosphofructokinase [Halomicrobium salinisoli]|uniref:1-phosphofructokinase n=1 Tax=Halomicrobium salinisoli TaxID=2878391 RepID=UPI001CF0C1BD|nr:1-phosphofructokinase [Halomicrobium salinisoli]